MENSLFGWNAYIMQTKCIVLNATGDEENITNRGCFSNLERAIIFYPPSMAKDTRKPREAVGDEPSSHQNTHARRPLHMGCRAVDLTWVTARIHAILTRKLLVSDQIGLICICQPSSPIFRTPEGKTGPLLESKRWKNSNSVLKKLWTSSTELKSYRAPTHTAAITSSPSSLSQIWIPHVERDFTCRTK